MKSRLVENILVAPTHYRKADSLNESEQKITIEEGGKEKSYKALAVYTFPISRPGEKNLNERVYPKKLWENVISKKMGEGASGLMDHPEREGSTKDEWCIWRNIRFSEDKKLILADAYLFGPWGEQVKAKLEAGGKVGLSTSGFGEFEKDGFTVKAESYDLERPADHVLNPSYSVFGEEDDKVADAPKKEEKVEEKVEDKVEIPEDDNKGEEKMSENKMASFEEKSFKLNIASRMKEIAVLEKASEKVESYSELLSYFEEGIAVDLKTEVETALMEAEAQVKELAEKGQSFDATIAEKTAELTAQVDTLTQENAELKDELEKISEAYEKGLALLDNTKAMTNKLKEMHEVALAEKNGMVTATEYKESLSMIEALEEEKEELVLKMNTLRDRLKRTREKVAESAKAPVKETEEIEEDETPEVDPLFEGVKPEIVNYYQDLEYSNPAVEAIKEDILGSKTLMEAQRTYLRLKGVLAGGDRSVHRDKYHEKDTAVRKTKTEFTSKKRNYIREGWN